MSVGIVEPDCWPTTDVAIVNYDILHKYPKKLSFMWDLVIADEVQMCKTPKARRTKALFGYRPTKKEQAAGVAFDSGVVAKRKLALTGTPIENRPIEVQPVLAWLQPDERRWSKWPFAKRYCGMQNNGWGVDITGASNLDELRTLLRQLVMVRRLKSQVLTELPPKTRQVITLKPVGATAECVRREARFMDENSEAIEAAQAEMELAKVAGSDEEFKASVAKMRDTFKVAFTEMARLRHETALAKVPDSIEFIQEQMEECPKVIVWAHHHDVVHALRDAFPHSVVLTGETNGKDAQAAVDRFQNDPACSPFIGGIRSAGEGITLTAANLEVFVEQDWVPGKMCQAEDRAHRIGQRDNVLIKYLVLEGSLDARVMKTLIEKMEIIERALDKGDKQIDSEPFVLPSSYKGGSRKQYRDEGELITDAQGRAIQLSLGLLAGRCDGARVLDGAGFSKVDAAIGHSLAEQGHLSPAQLALGRRICRKYVRQIGQETVEAMG